MVIATKQHSAAVVPSGPALMLNLLRWGDEVKTLDALELLSAGRKNISAAEMKMAKQLVAEMSGDWDPEDYKDEFSPPGQEAGRYEGQGWQDGKRHTA